MKKSKFKKPDITIVEVGLRDGLQNESITLSADIRVQFAKKLLAAGNHRMELGAFVRAEKIPQMVGSKEVIEQVLSFRKLNSEYSNAQFSVLVPNETGMEQALKTGIEEIAFFTATSDSFTKKNINCTVEESFERFLPVAKLAKKHKIKMRGYLSTCFGCPYEGEVPEKKVIQYAEKLYKMGCFEISIGDTIGVADPKQVQSVFKKLLKKIPANKLAGHFHDTRGTAIANVFAAYQLGIQIFDSSLGGLGGCPYAPGASGNVATEDLVYMFHHMGLSTNLNLEELVKINRWISSIMNKKLVAKVPGTFAT